MKAPKEPHTMVTQKVELQCTGEVDGQPCLNSELQEDAAFIDGKPLCYGCSRAAGLKWPSTERQRSYYRELCVERGELLDRRAFFWRTTKSILLSHPARGLFGDVVNLVKELLNIVGTIVLLPPVYALWAFRVIRTLSGPQVERARLTRIHTLNKSLDVIGGPHSQILKIHSADIR